jgi:mannitol/fructose-specific phosphotransferase system IIA component (Ntr-type)
MVFMIAAPSESDNEHLKVLSMLARKLMHEENRRALMDAVNGQEVIKVFDDEEAD